MVEGGQQITSIETHLQTGSELFDTNPKGALAAYYQAVSLDASHIEGWNQIGRLMFDMQQYSEARMVFTRVEQLANEQGLPDWAEMATQNIELTDQTLNDTATHEVVQQNGVQNDPIEDVVAAPIEQNDASEEVQSIEDISNIAAVTGLPEVPQNDQSILFDQAAPALNEVAPASAMPETEAPIAAFEPVFVPPAPVEPAPVVAGQVAPDVANGVPAEQIAVPPVPPVSPTPVMPSVDFSPANVQAGTTQAPVPPVNLAAPSEPPVPSLPPRAQTVAELQQQLHGQPPGLPAMPFPAQPQPSGAAPAPASHAAPAIPSMVPPMPDAEMQAPKSGAGKMALMITGVVGALGIGIGAAQYLNLGGGETDSTPLIKSEAKLASRQAANAPAARPVIPEPENAGRDQAYKIGMTHLVKGEYTRARAYLERAEGGGHAEAGYNLASMYAKGNGVEKNFEKAVAYLRRSSDGGYYPSMTNLGLLYAQGLGVEQNYLTARSYWLKAAAGEHPDAMHNLAVIYATGKGVDKDMDEAIKWYRKGANAGYVDSIANLGLIYANGDGVTRDYEEAKRLWEVASGKGHKAAIQNLAKLKQVMAQ